MRSLRSVRSGDLASAKVSAKASGAKEEKKEMARRKLTLGEQLKGVRAALRSRRTPPQLKEGLRKRAEALERQIAERSGGAK